MEVNLTNARPALLVLDLQELFTSADGPFKNTAAAGMINRVNSFTDGCDERGMPIIYSRYLLKDDLSDAGLLADNPLVKEGHFCESSPWMKLDQGLSPPASTIHLQRSRPGAFWNGRLDETLKQHGVDTLLLCGLSLNNAISTTARDAFARDIATVVVRDCSGAAPWETRLETYFEILDNWTAEVASAGDIMRRLK